jgi:hypothetical protein
VATQYYFERRAQACRLAQGVDHNLAAKMPSSMRHPMSAFGGKADIKRCKADFD